VVCDFQAIYRIRIDPDTGDFAGLTGPQFLRYASRLPAYEGAVQNRIRVLERDKEAGSTAPEPAVTMLDATPLMVTTHPLLAGLVEYTAAPPPT
jgi:hypothetical protein